MVYPQFSKKIIHPKSIAVCNVLKNAGYKAYLVGGCVRDLILNIEPKDWDITTDALPQKVIELFEKTYPTGLQHGTITVSIENELFEVTTFRVEGKYIDGRRPEEVFFVSDIYQDLSRRDLTINAMAYDPINNILIDPFHGNNDLQNKIIRAVGDPILRFNEDGLRIIRVARFAARFGYEVHEDTFYAMNSCLDTLKKVSKERVKSELCKIVMSNYSAYGLQILYDSNVLKLICPKLSDPDEPLIITMPTELNADLETRFAYLYKDLPIIDAKQELMDLKFSNKELKRILYLIDLNNKFRMAVKSGGTMAYKLFISHIKNTTPDTYDYTMEQFMKLFYAIGYDRSELHREFLNSYKDIIVLARSEMDINGDDLISIGIPVGPEIKKILDSCYQYILDNPENNERYKLIKYAMYGNLSIS